LRGYLLDTNAALIALTDPEALPSGVRTAILTGPNVLSVVSYWEVLLKSMKGNLDVGDPRAWWKDALDQLAATPLALRADHIAEIYTLPAVHKDPFDRVLIGQAAVEDLELVTTAAEIPLYASSRLKIIH
jgi:PIN domain nuclease of toxin-antitoxin system